MVVDNDGVPIIDVVELTRTNEELGTTDGSHAAYQIEYELRSMGFDEPGTLYAVYYEGDGMDPFICGATPSPEYSPGNTFTLFLQRDCERYPFAGEGEDANFWELTFMHELFHALGAVERCAPHDDNGHVDDPRDLMYGGRQEWSFPVQLDVDHDDYYGHGRHACYDIARSPYLTPNGEETGPYPSAFSDLEVNACQREADAVDGARPDSEVWIFNLQDDPIDIGQLDEDGDTSPIGAISGWSMMVLVGVPGDTSQIEDEDGDCLGTVEMPGYLDIGVVWVMP
jgi:hypothetical protein